MKIIGIASSPRANSNSTILCRKVLDVAKELGAETELIELRNLEYKGCIACGICKTTLDHCGQDDDLIDVLAKFKDADAIVMSSPVYFADVSGQLKCFIDRWYSFFGPEFKPRIEKGKKTVFIVTQGADDEKLFDDIIPRYSQWLTHMETEQYSIRGLGLGAEGEVLEREELMNQAEEIGKKLMK